MAVTKLYHLDEAGTQTLATYLLRCTNSRIKERIKTAINSAAYSDDDHVLSAKAILGLVGTADDTASDDTVYGYVNGQVADINAAIGDTEDTASDDTVYGYVNGQVADLEALIGGLTHLTYQEVVGPISGVQNPSETVLYLQRDEDAYRVGNDGYLLDSNGNHATYDDGENPEYEAWLDTSDNKIYKMVDGVKGAELPSNDPIFANVQKLADNTYNLYIWEKTSGEGVTPVTHKWVCVGDTSMELDNYWSKKDTDVAALQSLIIGSLTDVQVIAKVQAAWNATDPYANPSTNSYVPAAWES